jgi:hypothetical protein
MGMPFCGAEASLYSESGQYRPTMTRGGWGAIVPAGLCSCHGKRRTARGGYIHDGATATVAARWRCLSWGLQPSQPEVCHLT